MKPVSSTITSILFSSITLNIFSLYNHVLNYPIHGVQRDSRFAQFNNPYFWILKLLKHVCKIVKHSIFFHCASPVLKNIEAVCPACRKRQLLETINCSLTVNDELPSLIAWLDHSRQKTEVGGEQGHAPCRKILLQQIPIM